MPEQRIGKASRGKPNAGAAKIAKAARLNRVLHSSEYNVSRGNVSEAKAGAAKKVSAYRAKRQKAVRGRNR